MLLARAIESADREGTWILPAERRAATSEARAAAGGEELIVRRSSFLLAGLLEREPAVRRALRWSGWAGPPVALVVLVAFLLGFGLDRLGGGRTIHLLAPPLLGLLVWNLFVYALLVLEAMRERRARPGAGTAVEEPRVRPLTERFARLCSALGGVGRRWKLARLVSPDPALGDALRSFLAQWARLSAPLQLLRAKRLLHVAAATFALGALGGMYVRGLVLRYDASWESTFLEAQGVRTVLRVVLGPALFVSGQQLPPAEKLAEITEQPEGAAPWIHLWALDVLLIVVVPRLLLAAIAARRERRLLEDFPLDWRGDPWFLRVSAAQRGDETLACIVPYSYALSTRARERLADLLLDLFGSRARIRQEEPLEYGRDVVLEPLASPDDLAGGRCVWVLVFNLAQSPEAEVHGQLVDALAHQVEGSAGELGLLVVVDKAPYLERLGADREAEARVTERERSWRRTLRESGARAVFCRLDEPLGEAALVEAQGALLPEPAGRAAVPGRPEAARPTA